MNASSSIPCRVVIISDLGHYSNGKQESLLALSTIHQQTRPSTLEQLPPSLRDYLRVIGHLRIGSNMLRLTMGIKRGQALVNRIARYCSKMSVRPHDRMYDQEDWICARVLVLTAFRRGTYSRNPLSAYEEAFIACFGEHPKKLVPKWEAQHEYARQGLHMPSALPPKKPVQSVRPEHKVAKAGGAQ